MFCHAFSSNNAPTKMLRVSSCWNGVVESFQRHSRLTARRRENQLRFSAQPAGMLKPLVALTIVGCSEATAGYSFGSRTESPAPLWMLPLYSASQQVSAFCRLRDLVTWQC